jgi:hypothetical protein
MSQPWPGYNTSIYGGIHNISYHTEIHSVMPSDWDINVLSANLTFSNENFLGADPTKNLQQGNINSIDDVLTNNTGFVNVIIQFPSVAYKINEKSTIGFSWKLRALLFSNVSTDEFGNFIYGIEETSGDPKSFNGEFAVDL